MLRDCDWEVGVGVLSRRCDWEVGVGVFSRGCDWEVGVGVLSRGCDWEVGWRVVSGNCELVMYCSMISDSASNSADAFAFFLIRLSTNTYFLALYVTNIHMYI